MDRRSGIDRREWERKEISLDIEWEQEGERLHGTISDISRAGCFVLSGGEVADGQSIRLLIPLSDGMKAEFAGTVANHVQEIGFAVKFGPLSVSQQTIISGLMSDPSDK